MTANRRSLLVLTGAALVGTREVCAQQSPSDVVNEFQRGDPRGPREYVSFSRSAVAKNIKALKADYLPKQTNFGELLLGEAEKYVGFNRANNREAIGDFLEVFGLGFADSKGKPYAFCAAGIGYVAAKVYAKARNKTPSYAEVLKCLSEIDHYHFFPTPGVRNMMTVAEVHGRWVSAESVSGGKAKPLPGWLVVFRWNKTDHHVGILKSITGKQLKTIEFNTSPQGAQGSEANGGAVAERERNLEGSVLGFINSGIQVRT